MIDPAVWGVDPGYENVHREWVATPASSIDAVLRAMGAVEGTPPGLGPEDNPVWVVTVDEPVHVSGRWELRTEDGVVVETEGLLPPDLPLGYHELVRLDDGRAVRLIVTPQRCVPAPERRAWGWALQLYALRSQQSWGIGDLGDLRRWAGTDVGGRAAITLVNPLHAPLPGVPQQASPYYPSSRCFRSLSYFAVDGFAGADVADLTKRGAILNRRRRIDRDSIYELKLEGLERLWSTFTVDPAFDRYRAEVGPALRGYATFCTLAEVHGRPWTRWPAELRHPEGPAVARFAEDFGQRIKFHEWVQWLLDEQLAAAGAATALVADLAIGVDPAGADAWLWQDAFAADVRVGAPPDEFNPDGQDWGLPPFDPWRLRLARFEPFIQTVRAGLRHAAGLRVDHVMGMFRLYWIPADAGPAEGAYVRYPSKELLDILALESHRAAAYVVGEDLGTVEPEVRDVLVDREVLSYRLLWFEEDQPTAWPEKSLAAVTTHDLPTVAGVFSNRDQPELRSKLSGASVSEAVVHAYDAVAASPSLLMAATLEDALGVEERPNYPGTIDDANWSRALPMTLEEAAEDARVAHLAEVLNARRP